jgi:hypothetical protein
VTPSDSTTRVCSNRTRPVFCRSKTDAAAQQDRRDAHLDLVEEPGAQELLGDVCGAEGDRLLVRDIERSTITLPMRHLAFRSSGTELSDRGAARAR